MAGRGGRFGGAMRSAAAGSGGDASVDVRTELALGKASAASTREMAAILKPYFLPSGGWRAKALAMSCFGLLGLSKVASIASPAFLGMAVEDLVRGRYPIANIIAFGALRFAGSLLEEAQRLVYLRVKEVAYHEVAVRTFHHLLSLSFQWHVTKKLGVVLRASDRGINAASTIVDMLFLRLIPTILEALTLAILFSTQYGSPGAAAVLIASFILYFGATAALTRVRTSIRAKLNVADNDASQVAADVLAGFETVKAWSAEKREEERYSEVVRTQQQLTRSSQAALVALNLTQQLILRGALIGVLVAASFDVLAGRSSIGDWVALQAYMVQLFQPLVWLGTLYTMIAQAASDMRNLADLLKEPATVTDAPDAMPLVLRDTTTLLTATGGGVSPPPPRIEFRNVSFAYSTAANRIEQQMDAVRVATAAAGGGGGGKEGGGRVSGSTKKGGAQLSGQLVAPGGADDWDTVTVVSLPSTAAEGAAVVTAPSSTVGARAPRLPPSAPPAALPSEEKGSGRLVLSDVSFSVPAGCMCAIVGSTGSGKSTLTRLLLRFQDPTRGEILLDGQPLLSLTQASVRGTAMAYVPQDIALFNDTLERNITYSKPQASPAEVARAVEMAQLSEMVASLPQGLATRVGERGLKLSGGERQRVAIARALLADSPILVLDEATSALDSVTERQVQAAIARLRSGRTTVVVAHRLSTVQDANEILVLENGAIVERGTHAALVAAGGRYHTLWTRQREEAAAPPDNAAVPPTGT